MNFDRKEMVSESILNAMQTPSTLLCMLVRHIIMEKTKKLTLD